MEYCCIGEREKVVVDLAGKTRQFVCSVYCYYLCPVLIGFKISHLEVGLALSEDYESVTY